MIHATGNVSLSGSHKRWNNLNKGANCKLLIHSDTTNNSTTFVDSIGTHTPSNQGDVKHSTTQKKFGATSIYFDGTGDYITIPDHADWYMGTGAFTIDCWVYPTTNPNAAIIEQYVDDENVVSLFFSNGYLNARRFSTAGTNFAMSSATVTPQNTWTHVALIRGWKGVANTWALTSNGAAVDTDTEADEWTDMAAALEIGRTKYGAGETYYQGFIDEIRIVKGTAMWTNTFFPPIGRYI